MLLLVNLSSFLVFYLQNKKVIVFSSSFLKKYTLNDLVYSFYLYQVYSLNISEYT